MIRLLYLAPDGLGSSHFYCLFLRRRVGLGLGSLIEAKKYLCVHRGERERVRAREWWLRWPNTQKGTFRVFRGDTDRLVAVWMGRRRRR